MEPVASAARIGGVSLLRLQSDEALARLAATGSDEAFEALVRRYRNALLRSCRRLLSEDRAEDAVQQALLDAHQALARNGTPERFRPWLHRIAVNAAIKIARAGEDVAPIPVDEGKTNGGESPEQAHERRERLRQTVRAIHALPRRQRRALVLRELEGRSHDEIARELGLSGGAVRQLIHRARESVRSAASALIPPAFVLRLLGAGTGAPVEEVAAGGAGGAVAAKVAVAALVTGGVAGGIALEHPGGDRSSSAGAAQTRESAGDTGAPAASRLGEDVTAGSFAGSGSSGRSGSNSGPGGGGDGSSGPGSGASDNSGPGSSEGEGSGSSGSGSDDDLVSSGSDSSGSGSSGSDSSGSDSSGSGSGGTPSSASGSSGSGSSATIDSGSSGSGAYASDSSGTGSTSETSGTSGSGSSGSGSGED
ncbi:MAG TPA: sigma-70 family RNA polymerase sigma factor [Solirubrobacterales bacterium]|nr:sigma-70 family RNA polymerase sigma factor [Solirubrobacterales bacterium]